eukprot:scaffold12297_cov96-Isochrysis_galbana.AAC.2
MFWIHGSCEQYATRPRTTTLPPSRGTSPMRACSRVDLPEPDGPAKPTSQPCRSSRLRSYTPPAEGEMPSGGAAGGAAGPSGGENKTPAEGAAGGAAGGAAPAPGWVAVSEQVGALLAEAEGCAAGACAAAV